MKKKFSIFQLIISSLFLLSSISFTQSEYVRSDHKVYDFLNRLDVLNIIESYNSFEKPQTRRTIASLLKQAREHKNQLDENDQVLLNDFFVEFEYDIDSSVKNAQSIINGDFNIFSENEKYIYLITEKDKAAIFVNFLAEGNYLSVNNKYKNLNSESGLFGGEIRGTFLNHYGFLLRSTNGIAFGNKGASLTKKELRYNWKFNEKSDESFFDETEGYFSTDFELVKIKFGRDRFIISNNFSNPLLGTSAPVFDYLYINFNYKFFNYSFMHGKLLGKISSVNDSIYGVINKVEDKFIGYHRIGFDVSKHLSFGFGEFIIYSDRSIDFSYLNPFSFYKTSEHNNQDRDNSLLFMDIANNSIDGLKLSGTLLIDDIDFGKVGKNWWGNQTLWSFSISSYNFYRILPIDLHCEYTQIEPYVFTHRLNRNNFTNHGFNLSNDIEPNSELFFAKINYRFNYRINISLDYTYIRHGANPVDKNGNIVKNVGGDINLGHRVFDSSIASFLEGAKEQFRKFSFSFICEPVNEFIISFILTNENNSYQNNVNINNWISDLSFKIKI